MPINLETIESPDGAVTAYWATNMWFDFALRWAQQKTPDDVQQFHLTWHFDELLPPELAELQYLPAVKVMEQWKTQFFNHQDQRTGLIESLSRAADDTSLQEAVRSAHHLKVVQRMYDFLEWFPGDVQLKRQCELWARNIMSPQPSGHRVSATSWTLHPYISARDSEPVVGLPEGARYAKLDVLAQLAKAFELLDFLLGGRESGRFSTGHVRRRARPPLTRLQLEAPDPHNTAADPVYGAFARDLNWMVFEHRHDWMPVAERRRHRDLSLVPDKFDATGWGRLDRGDLYDTDTLYWARFLFDAYWLAGGDRRPDLQGDSWGSRRQKLSRIDLPSSQQLSNGDLVPTREARRYLRMALGVTLDWIRCAWYESQTPNGTWPYLVRKVRSDGTIGVRQIWGDGMWNTLYILVGAFRVTGDGYYLDLLSTIWSTHEAMAAEAPQPFLWNIRHADGGREWLECVDMSHRRGLFHPITNGALATGCDDPNSPTEPGSLVPQERFIDVMIDAYSATVEWGAPRAEFLDRAERLARTVRALYDPYQLTRRFPRPHLSKELPPVFAEDKGYLASGVLLKLATAQGKPHPIEFLVSEPETKLEIARSGAEPTEWVSEIAVPGTRAIVYMDPGDYHVVVRRPSVSEPGVPEPLSVPRDTPVVL